MRDITPEHLAFVEEAAKAFEQNSRWETFQNKEGALIALRFGMDRDCVMVYELGDCIGNFVQQVDVRHTAVRKEVDWFAREMEQQLRANEHKGGWRDSPERFLLEELHRNLNALFDTISKEEYIRRCVNAANFAMMLADNKRREEVLRF